VLGFGSDMPAFLMQTFTVPPETPAGAPKAATEKPVARTPRTRAPRKKPEPTAEA
jgi:hypothetical protein